MAILEHPHYVYELYDESGALLYVGETRNPATRLESHLEKWWGRKVRRVELLPCPGKEEAKSLEKRLIVEKCPALNQVHNIKCGDQAVSVVRATDRVQYDLPYSDRARELEVEYGVRVDDMVDAAYKIIKTRGRVQNADLFEMLMGRPPVHTMSHLQMFSRVLTPSLKGRVLKVRNHLGTVWVCAVKGAQTHCSNSVREEDRNEVQFSQVGRGAAEEVIDNCQHGEEE